MYQNLVVAGGVRRRAGQRSPDALADGRAGRRCNDRALAGLDGRSSRGSSTWPGRCAARPASRSASRWLECGSPCPARSGWSSARRSWLSSRDEVNVKSIELIGDESELVDRRVKPLLPKIGKKLGAAIPAVMAAAREGRFEILRRRFGPPRRT